MYEARIIWISMRPEIYVKLKEKAKSEGYATRTKCLLDAIEKYNGEKIEIDRKFSSYDRKITSMKLIKRDEEMINKKAELAGMKVPDFVRNMAYLSYCYFLKLFIAKAKSLRLFH